MALTDPFRELEQLRRDLDETLGRVFGAGSGPLGRPWRLAFLPGRAARQYPLVNVYQEGDDYHVEALAPGLDPDKVDVTVVQNTLTIAGEKTGAGDVAPERVHRTERAAGRFVRTVQLPDEVDRERVSATYRNGLLLLTLPRAEQARPRRIQVQAG